MLWSAEDPAALRSLAYSGSAALLDREEKCLLFSYGDDPQLQLPLYRMRVKRYPSQFRFDLIERSRPLPRR